MVAGTSGVIAKTMCAPLERVKILLQVYVAWVWVHVWDWMGEALNCKTG